MLDRHFRISDEASSEVLAGFAGEVRNGSLKVSRCRVAFEVLAKCPTCFLVVYGRAIFWFQGLASLVALRGVFSTLFVAVPSVNNPTSQ